MVRFVLNSKLKKAAKRKNPTAEQEDDMVKFFLCFLFNCFLFTNTHCNLRKGFLHYIEDLEDLPNLN